MILGGQHITGPLAVNAATHPTTTLVLEGTYPAQVGGISTWVHHLLQGDAPVRILRIGRLPPKADWTHQPPANVESVVEISEPARLDAACVREWARMVARRVPPDGVVQAVGAGLAAAVGLAAQQRGSRLIVSEHASYIEELEAGAPFLESGRRVAADETRTVLDTFEEIRTTCYRNADIVTSLYPARMEDQLQRGLAESRARVISNGVDIPRRPRPLPHVFAPVFLGRIAPIKDPTAFVDILSRANAVAPMRGRMFGPLDCPACEEVKFREAIAQSRGVVRWQGSVTTDEALQNASVLVLTSRLEAQPLVVLEAMARGIPVVSTDVGDVHRMVCSDRLGAPAGVVSSSKRELAATLVELSCDPRRLVNLGEAARQRASAHFDVARMRREYALLYALPMTHERAAS